MGTQLQPPPAGPTPFISFAGIDGSGKTTLASAAVAALRRHGEDVIYTKTRLSATRSIFALSAELFGDPHGYDPGIPPSLREFVVACDVVEHFRTTISPALAGGTRVVWDRGPVCYEAYARSYGADQYWIRQMLGLVRRPDVTFLLDIDPNLAWRRIRTRSEKPPLTSEQPWFLGRVRAEYLAIAEDRPDILVLDGARPPGELAERVAGHLGLLPSGSPATATGFRRRRVG